MNDNGPTRLALAIHRHNEPFTERIKTTVESRKEVTLHEEFRNKFLKVSSAAN